MAPLLRRSLGAAKNGKRASVLGWYRDMLFCGSNHLVIAQQRLN